MYEDLAQYVPLAIIVVLLLISWAITKLLPNSRISKKVRSAVEWIVDGLRWA
jgi:hypothetical protein